MPEPPNKKTNILIGEHKKATKTTTQAEYGVKKPQPITPKEGFINRNNCKSLLNSIIFKRRQCGPDWAKKRL